MSDRFFHPAGFESDKITLTGTEAHHLLHVLRAQVGLQIELFDGQGRSAEGEVVNTGRREAEVELSNRYQSPPLRGLTLLTAVPKGDRFRWLVEKATELGVSRLIPVSTARSVVTPRETKLQKMEQTVIAACKQSGRNWLMPIGEMLALADALGQISSTEQLLAAHPSGQSLSEFSGNRDQDYTLVIGPEGGFTEEEFSLLQTSNACVVSLGETILRTETAAIALCAWYRLAISG